MTCYTAALAVQGIKHGIINWIPDGQETYRGAALTRGGDAAADNSMGLLAAWFRSFVPGNVQPL
jgi:hypothetical protein